VSGRMTQSRSRNAVMDMPPAPPTRIMVMLEGMLQQGRHPDPHPGIALVGSKPPSNNKLEVRQWQSTSNAEWDQHARAHWNQSGGSSSSVTPPLFAARRSFSARGYRELSQGICNINLQVDDIGHRQQQLEGAFYQYVDNTTHHHHHQDGAACPNPRLAKATRRGDESFLPVPGVQPRRRSMS
jgi:hypothetical protein